MACKGCEHSIGDGLLIVLNPRSKDKPLPIIRCWLKSRGITQLTFAKVLCRPLSEARLIAAGHLIPSKAERDIVCELLGQPQNQAAQTKILRASDTDLAVADSILAILV